MAARSFIFMAAGLAVVAGLIFFLFGVTTGAHVRLEGTILKVRTYHQPGSAATLAFVDFRATNPSDVPFIVDSIKLRLEPDAGEAVEAAALSKYDTETVFQYQKLLGPKYNEVPVTHDRIAPHQSVDRMVGARFEVPEATIEMRKSLRIEIAGFDGAIAEIAETK